MSHMTIHKSHDQKIVLIHFVTIKGHLSGYFWPYDGHFPDFFNTQGSIGQWKTRI